MNLMDFNVIEEEIKEKMLTNLKEHKLENIKSLWYFVKSSAKSTIAGSKA